MTDQKDEKKGREKNTVNQRFFEILCLVGRTENVTGAPVPPKHIQENMRKAEADAKAEFLTRSEENQEVLTHYKAQPYGQIKDKLATLVGEGLLERINERYKQTPTGYELFKLLQGQTINPSCASFRLDYKEWVVARALFLAQAPLKVEALANITFLSEKAIRRSLDALKDDGTVQKQPGRAYLYVGAGKPKELPYTTKFPVRSAHGKGKKKPELEPEPPIELPTEQIPPEHSKESPGVIALFDDDSPDNLRPSLVDILTEQLWPKFRSRIRRMIDDRIENVVDNVVEKKLRARKTQ